MRATLPGVGILHPTEHNVSDPAFLDVAGDTNQEEAVKDTKIFFESAKTIRPNSFRTIGCKIMF